MTFGKKLNKAFSKLNKKEAKLDEALNNLDAKLANTLLQVNNLQGGK